MNQVRHQHSDEIRLATFCTAVGLKRSSVHARTTDSGWAYYTPQQVFTYRDRHIARTQQTGLTRQDQRHHERFGKWPPGTTLPPEKMCINPVAPDEAGASALLAVNFPTSEQRRSGKHVNCFSGTQN